jgi:hypothetical protein
MGSGAEPITCKWVKEKGQAKDFDFDITKTDQIFDFLLKEKQLKFPDGHKFPTMQELRGKSYCKWHHSFTHNTKDCNVSAGKFKQPLNRVGFSSKSPRCRLTPRHSPMSTWQSRRIIWSFRSLHDVGWNSPHQSSWSGLPNIVMRRR